MSTFTHHYGICQPKTIEERTDQRHPAKLPSHPKHANNLSPNQTQQPTSLGITTASADLHDCTKCQLPNTKQHNTTCLWKKTLEAAEII